MANATTPLITIFRKAPSAAGWGRSLGTVPANATSYDDVNAGVGTAWEYRVSLDGQSAYIMGGNAVFPIESRGTILLVVEETQLDVSRDVSGTTLAPELDRFKRDLIGDGYAVVTIQAPRIDVPRDLPTALADPNVNTSDPAIQTLIAQTFGPYKQAVSSVKQSIRTVWNTHPNLSNVFLIGHVPVPYSGTRADDGHGEHNGAWPADLYYSTLSSPEAVWQLKDAATKVSYLSTGGAQLSVYSANKNFPGDGKFDLDTTEDGTYNNNSLFSDVAVSRIDAAMMSIYPGVAYNVGATATVAETQLLKAYFEKDHRWRIGDLTSKRQALVDEYAPFDGNFNEANFSANVGRNKIVYGRVSATNAEKSNGQGQNHDLNNDSWLWVYAAGPGQRSGVDDLINLAGSSDTDPLHRHLRGSDYADAASGVHKGVFNLIFGSYLGDWDFQGSTLRSVVVDPAGSGLTAAWGSFPERLTHLAALGRSMGDLLLSSQNNFGSRNLYPGQPGGSTSISLLGDLTLRQEMFAPVTGVTLLSRQQGNLTENGTSATEVDWTASTEPGVAGSQIYWSASSDGPYIGLPDGDADANNVVEGTTFTDADPTHRGGYYMVRAAKLTDTPSGSYWNLSTGVVVASIAVDAEFRWRDAPQTLAVNLTARGVVEVAASNITLAGQRWDAGSEMFVPVTLVAGVDYSIVPSTLPSGFRLTILSSSEYGTSGVLPSGRYTFSVHGQSATFEQHIVFVSGDVNNDGIVNFVDLLVLSQNYGQDGSTGSTLDFTFDSFGVGDFNNDGKVDFDDLLILAQNYGLNVN